MKAKISGRLNWKKGKNIKNANLFFFQRERERGGRGRGRESVLCVRLNRSKIKENRKKIA